MKQHNQNEDDGGQIVEEEVQTNGFCYFWVESSYRASKILKPTGDLIVLAVLLKGGRAAKDCSIGVGSCV